MRKNVGPPKNPSDRSASLTASTENKDKCTDMNNFSYFTLKPTRVANIYLLHKATVFDAISHKVCEKKENDQEVKKSRIVRMDTTPT